MFWKIGNRVALVGALFALLSLPGESPAVGQEIGVETGDREISGEIGLEPVGQEIELSLDRAVEIALERNLDLLVQRYERSQFQLRIDESLGIYDLGLGGSVQASEETTPAASELEGADVRTTERRNLNLNVSQLTPFGGTVESTFNLFRQEDNSAFFLPIFYSSGWDASVTQPFLRDFGRLATDRGIRIARLNSAQNLETFEVEVARTIQEVETAYWNLVESRSQLEVAREGRELAVELHERNKIRVDVGTLAPLELIQSEVGIATREEEIILAQAAVEDAEDRLRQLLNFEEGPLWNVDLVPTTEGGIERMEITLEESLETALDERPELARKDLEVKTLELDERYYHNQALPRLDLSATYGYNSLGIELSNALDDLVRRDFEGWQVQLTFAYPLQNTSAEARATIAKLDLEQGRAERSRLVQTIRTEVRGAVRDLRTTFQQIESAQASRRLAEENLEAERKRYESGLSTSFQVLEIQEDLTAARSREVAAIASYQRAQAAYHRAVGRLLEEKSVELIDSPAVR